MSKPAKWTKHLTKKQLNHLGETCESGRPTLRALRLNLLDSIEECSECKAIEARLLEKGVRI